MRWVKRLGWIDGGQGLEIYVTADRCNVRKVRGRIEGG